MMTKSQYENDTNVVERSLKKTLNMDPVVTAEGTQVPDCVIVLRSFPLCCFIYFFR